MQSGYISVTSTVHQLSCVVIVPEHWTSCRACAGRICNCVMRQGNSQVRVSHGCLTIVATGMVRIQFKNPGVHDHTNRQEPQQCTFLNMAGTVFTSVSSSSLTLFLFSSATPFLVQMLPLLTYDLRTNSTGTRVISFTHMDEIHFSPASSCFSAHSCKHTSSVMH